MNNLQERLAEAIKHFWRTRVDQASRQGTLAGQKDAGFRSAATGGAQQEPAPEPSFQNFAASLLARAIAYMKIK
jgi:hypothetical protein